MPTVTQHPHLIYTDTDKKPKKLPAAIAKKFKRGWEIQQEVKKLNNELKDIKAALEEKYGAGVKLILPDEKASLTITDKRTIGIRDFDLLRELVRDDDNNLFGMNAYTVKDISYSPTDRYKDIVEDKEHEQHQLLIDTAEIKDAVTLTFRAIK